MNVTLQDVIWPAMKAVQKHQQLLMANLTGNAFLVFILYSWIVVSDRSLTELLSSGAGLLVILFSGVWLQAATLAAFSQESSTTPFVPVLKRMPKYLPWAGAMAGTVALFAWMSSVLGFLVWVVGMAVLMALLPLASQAASGRFSRKTAAEIVYREQYWIIGTALLVVGLYAPFLVFNSLPVPEDAFLRTIMDGVRIGLSCFLSISSWVVFAAVIGRLGWLIENAPVETAAANDTAPSPATDDDEAPTAIRAPSQ